MLALDVVLPLVLYYALRAIGTSSWTALVAGAAVPLVRVAVAAATRRCVESAGVFTLTLLAAGTAVACSLPTPGCSWRGRAG